MSFFETWLYTPEQPAGLPAPLAGAARGVLEAASPLAGRKLKK